MTDTAPQTSPATLLADLHPPRLPEAFTSAGADDFLSAAGLGLLLAVLILSLARGALRRRPRALGKAGLIRKAREAPADQRLILLLQLAKAQGKELSPALRARLYEGRLPADELESLITGQAVGKAGG